MWWPTSGTPFEDATFSLVLFDPPHLKHLGDSAWLAKKYGIKGIRIERLQDISDEDCLKEGIRKSATDNVIGYPFGVRFNYYFGEDKKGCRYVTPREAYAALIDKVSGKGTWERNLYVVVYDYQLVK